MKILLTGIGKNLGYSLIKNLQNTPNRDIYLISRKSVELTQKVFSDEGIFLDKNKIIQVDFDKNTPQYIQKKLARLPRMQTIVHCASPYHEESIQKASVDIFSTYGHFFANNLTLSQFALANMKGGRFIVIGSCAGTLKSVAPSPYGVYKFSLFGLCEAFSSLGKKHGNTATCIFPGSFASDKIAKSKHGEILPISQVSKRIMDLIDTDPNIVIDHLGIQSIDSL